MNLEKREWCYVVPPAAFDIRCDRCCHDEDLSSGKGANIAWSEYKGMIWCFDCEIDTPGTPGIFDGPIPLQATYMLGLNFDRINLKTDQIEKFNLQHAVETGELVWEPPNKVTKKKLSGKDFYGERLQRKGSQYFELIDRGIDSDNPG